MVQINGDRLIATLREVAQFGAYKTGVHRPTFSSQDMDARAWLIQRMEQAGLSASIDGVANVIGRSSNNGPVLLVGSHSESQNYAGWLDGILGVIYGLELAQSIHEQGLPFAVDVGAWSDEECHYLQFLGSRSFCDDLADHEIDVARNKDTREPLRDALRRVGLEGRPRELIDPSRYVGYLEAHIEQGDYLDSHDLKAGIVTSIVGLWQYRITVKGQQNHAGATRMVARKDAGVALMRLFAMIEERFPQIAGERSVWTVGKIELDPGAPSIIPGGAEMLFQFRDESLVQLERFERELVGLIEKLNAAGPCEYELHIVDKAVPKVMDPSLQNHLEAAAERFAPGKAVRMPSGAMHDAQIFAKRLSASMLFVPSIGGISHHWTENTSDDDIILGGRIFASAAGSILKEAAV
ncbi:hydantoinase/carbamoylase family amidase [Microvirga sp. M2]|uniref:hydantoinase/carbamoylase family amidase n=1 Tax=Microvirga sp. M2 TaxID=3073270 RepID=UPI0039C2994E